jgi:hypothetical protein
MSTPEQTVPVVPLGKTGIGKGRFPFYVKTDSMKFIYLLLFSLLIGPTATAVPNRNLPASHVSDASAFGFSPDSSGIQNRLALQRAVDQGGTIRITVPGTYKMAGTVYVGSHTSLIFDSNVFLKKVDEAGLFTHVLLNKGALTKTYDENIRIEGLQIVVNNIDKASTEVFGLRGQLAFFYVKDLVVSGFRCLDLGKAQYGIHVCTFEDILIQNSIIKGAKDGIHLGRGTRFTIRDAAFQTYDDAIALNAHDYATSNPELGWIEDGVVENCHDLNEEKTVGYFCRILAGAWIDWQPGMKVQNSDTVVSNGRLYRVQAKPDGTVFDSRTRPDHTSGSKELDGIRWGVVQDDVTYTAGVRNVVFRDIFLSKPRIGFSVHFDNDRFSRSYYPGSIVPKQEQLLFDNIRVLHGEKKELLSIATPVDVITIANSSIRNNSIRFTGNNAMPDYLKTIVNVYGCVFNHESEMDLISNSVKDKEIILKTSSNVSLHQGFKANVANPQGKVTITSDLPGLESRP